MNGLPNTWLIRKKNQIRSSHWNCMRYTPYLRTETMSHKNALFCCGIHIQRAPLHEYSTDCDGQTRILHFSRVEMEVKSITIAYQLAW